MSKTKALSERCEQQCFAKGFVELQTVVRSFSYGDSNIRNKFNKGKHNKNPGKKGWDDSSQWDSSQWDGYSPSRTTTEQRRLEQPRLGPNLEQSWTKCSANYKQRAPCLALSGPPGCNYPKKEFMYTFVQEQKGSFCEYVQTYSRKKTRCPKQERRPSLSKPQETLVRTSRQRDHRLNLDVHTPKDFTRVPYASGQGKTSTDKRRKTTQHVGIPLLSKLERTKRRGV